MSHEWKMDAARTRYDINILVWKCRTCGCLQIKKGGMKAPSIYKPDAANWNPFKTTDREPACHKEWQEQYAYKSAQERDEKQNN